MGEEYEKSIYTLRGDGFAVRGVRRQWDRNEQNDDKDGAEPTEEQHAHKSRGGTNAYLIYNLRKRGLQKGAGESLWGEGKGSKKKISRRKKERVKTSRNRKECNSIIRKEKIAGDTAMEHNELCFRKRVLRRPMAGRR